MNVRAEKITFNTAHVNLSGDERFFKFIEILELLKTEETDGLLCTTDHFTFAIVWKDECYYLLDSHARDVFGIQMTDGRASFLKFKCVVELATFLTDQYWSRLSDWSFVYAEEVHVGNELHRKKIHTWTRPEIDDVQWTDHTDRRLNMPGSNPSIIKGVNHNDDDDDDEDDDDDDDDEDDGDDDDHDHDHDDDNEGEVQNGDM